MNPSLPKADPSMEPPADESTAGGYCRQCLVLLDSVPSSVLLLDHQLRIILVNRKFLSKSRLSETDVVGHRLEEVFPTVIYQDMDFRQRVSEVFRSGRGDRRRAFGLPGARFTGPHLLL